MRYALAAVILVAAACDAQAAAMVCKNPRREYAASFSEDSRKFFADDTQYTVLLVENNQQRYSVSGLTLKDGPEFRAQFRPKKQIEFYVDGKLFQTDRCR